MPWVLEHLRWALRYLISSEERKILEKELNLALLEKLEE